MSIIIPNNLTDLKTTLGLGTVVDKDVGTSAGNILQLDASGNLPAVDGSNLTDFSASSGDRYYAYLTADVSFDDANGVSMFGQGTWSTNFNDNTSFANNRFTPTVAGYYLTVAQCTVDCEGAGNLIASVFDLRKNGSTQLQQENNQTANYSRRRPHHLISIVYMNGTTDYIDYKIYTNDLNGVPQMEGNAGSTRTYAFAHRLNIG
jgi:hypothetical protein